MSDRDSQRSWGTPIRLAFTRICGLYRFYGIAKYDDDLAIQQLHWAIKRTDKKMLPTREEAERLVSSIEDAIAASGRRLPKKDLEFVARLPDLMIQYVAEISRENYHSGAEYIERVVLEGLVDCSQLRSRAQSLARQRTPRRLQPSCVPGKRSRKS